MSFSWVRREQPHAFSAYPAKQNRLNSQASQSGYRSKRGGSTASFGALSARPESGKLGHETHFAGVDLAFSACLSAEDNAPTSTFGFRNSDFAAYSYSPRLQTGLPVLKTWLDEKDGRQTVSEQAESGGHPIPSWLLPSASLRAIRGLKSFLSLRPLPFLVANT